MLIKNAGVVAFVVTAAFAALIWWYAMQSGVVEATYFIIVGIALALMDALVLWLLLMNKSNNKKKGKK
jgi:ABC-type enterobactin transport system permease subunit